MRHFFLGGWVWVLSFGLAACGGGTVDATGEGPSCVGTKSGVKFCADFTLAEEVADAEAQVQAMCTTQLGGTYAAKACDRTGAVGGCEYANAAADEITWFYSDSGATAAQIESACAQQGQTFVKP